MINADIAGTRQTEKFQRLGRQSKGIDEGLGKQDLLLPLCHLLLPCPQSIEAQVIGRRWSVRSGAGEKGVLVIVHELRVEVSQF